jgi:hypothetical protein
MAKITVGNKEFTPPPISPTTEQVVETPKPSSLRKFTKKEIYTLVGVVLFLVTLGFLPTQITYKHKISKLEQQIDQIDPLNKVETDLRYKLSKLESDINVEDDDLYKILSQMRNERRLMILDQLEQIQLYKSIQNITTIEFYNNKIQELKQKELLYHR